MISVYSTMFHVAPLNEDQTSGQDLCQQRRVITLDAWYIEVIKSVSELVCDKETLAVFYAQAINSSSRGDPNLSQIPEQANESCVQRKPKDEKVILRVIKGLFLRLFRIK